jgi:hypothetical protein
VTRPLSVAQLRDIAGELATGATLSQCATDYGLPPTTLYYRLKIHGLRTRHAASLLSPAQERVHALRTKGVAWPEIARQAGYTVPSAQTRYFEARRKLKALAATRKPRERRPPRPLDDFDRALLALDGETVAQVAARFGATKNMASGRRFRALRRVER